MENLNQPNTQYPQSANQAKTFSRAQISLLTRSMIAAGISFLLIGLIGFGISFGLTQTMSYDALNTSVGILWGISIVFIIVAMIMSMVVSRRMNTASKGLVLSMYGVYIVAEGAGFGILFTAFFAQFALSKGIGYLSLIFAVAGISFLIAGLIGKKLSLRQTMSLGKFLAYASIGFMIMFMVFMIVFMVLMLTNAAGGGMMNNMYMLLIAISTLLFFGYTVYDISKISKMQQFMVYDGSTPAWNLMMFCGFQLLVDFVGLFWNIAIIFLRFAR